jgi:hypothetical protein
MPVKEASAVPQGDPGLGGMAGKRAFPREEPFFF